MRISIFRLTSYYSCQVILAEGQTIPGDCQLICDYNAPQDFEEFKKLRDEDKFAADAAQESGNDANGQDGGNKEKEAEDDDDRSIHYGHSLIACGKQRPHSLDLMALVEN